MVAVRRCEAGTLPLASAGTYALLLTARERGDVRVGRLGRLWLVPGVYLYCGSAFGPGGLRARIAHHCRASGHPRWHIDYLRRCLPVTGLWYTYDPVRREAQWADLLVQRRDATVPLAGFGASDRHGATHLIRFPRPPAARWLARHLDGGAGHCLIHTVEPRVGSDGHRTICP